ncbi:hypothetical protein BGZ82_010137 [Podila clonocystis]|nr:hypothetical protein BGZ82_010137 [Podila clonocystis]
MISMKSDNVGPLFDRDDASRDRGKGEVEVDEQESQVNKGSGDPWTEPVGSDGDEDKDEDEDDNEQDVDVDEDDWEDKEGEHESGLKDGGEGNEAPALSDIGSNRTQSDEVEEASQDVHDAFSTYEEIDVPDTYRFLEKCTDKTEFDELRQTVHAQSQESYNRAVTELSRRLSSNSSSTTALTRYQPVAL